MKKLIINEEDLEECIYGKTTPCSLNGKIIGNVSFDKKLSPSEIELKIKNKATVLSEEDIKFLWNECEAVHPADEKEYIKIISKLGDIV